MQYVSGWVLGGGGEGGRHAEGDGVGGDAEGAAEGVGWGKY